ncbi:MAG: hypothetical protein Q7R33_06380, partial [Nitrosarchaeum sp.]|nr:hypothetical protein [Nitrosarchaeum sp.]
IQRRSVFQVSKITQNLFNCLARFSDHKIFLKRLVGNCMMYYLELQMAGVILLSAMAVGGISLWLKRRKEQHKLDVHDDKVQNI